MTSRAEQIDQILRQRAVWSERLGSLDGSMVGLADTVDALDGARQALQHKADPAAAAELDQVAAGVAELQRKVAAARRDIGRTDARMRRRSLTIGAVGRSGQGKSRFLQSLTGLTDREIPAGRGGFMTGAPSVIRHDPNGTAAEVEFHDEVSFLADIIAPYYRALGLGPEPMSLDDFERSRPAEPAFEHSRDQQAFDHLCAYRDNLAKYRDYLTGPIRVRPIRPEEIRQFVAQHDEQGVPTHEFRAVRRMRIAAPFLTEDLGRLAVIDLPGLGDTNLHDEFVLRQALEDEVDLVLFLRRPDPLRVVVQEVDVDLYDVARNALPELPIDRWSYLVLNRIDGGDGGNGDAVEPFAAAVRRSRIHVSDIGVANCAEPGEVAAAFDTVVAHAVGTLDELDRLLVERRRSQVEAVRAEALTLADQARTVSRRAVPSSAWFPHFLQLFNGVYGTLARSLEELVAQLGDGVTERDDGLDGAIAQALRSARTNVVVPSVDEIQTRVATAGALPNVLFDLVNESRSQVAREFLSLDSALKQHVDAMHDRVADVLAEAGGLATGTPDEPGRARLRALEARLPDDGSTPELRYGLQFLTEFVLNYRGMIQHRVRRVLDKLTPAQVSYEHGVGPDGVRYMVEELVAETLFEIESALQDIAFEPREAVFAVVEEFRDRVLRSPGAKDEWRTVYEALRTEVWAEEFAALADKTNLFTRWNRAVTDLAGVAAGTQPAGEER